MADTVIENPVINSAFREPASHFRFSDDGITDRIKGSRRVSSYFVPIAQPFFIPYYLNGVEHRYVPDFIVRLRVPRSRGEGATAGEAMPQKEATGDTILNLLLEVSGEAKKEKAAKVAAARNLWVPAVNNHGGFGRWEFLEISDPWDVQNTIRGFLAADGARNPHLTAGKEPDQS